MLILYIFNDLGLGILLKTLYISKVYITSQSLLVMGASS